MYSLDIKSAAITACGFTCRFRILARFSRADHSMYRRWNSCCVGNQDDFRRSRRRIRKFTNTNIQCTRTSLRSCFCPAPSMLESRILQVFDHVAPTRFLGYIRSDCRIDEVQSSTSPIEDLLTNSYPKRIEIRTVRKSIPFSKKTFSVFRHRRHGIRQ